MFVTSDSPMSPDGGSRATEGVQTLMTVDARPPHWLVAWLQLESPLEGLWMGVDELLVKGFILDLFISIH